MKREGVTRRLISHAIRSFNNREGLSIFLLFLSWPVCLVHTFWNNSKVHAGHWFLSEVRKSNGKLFTQDIQYYIMDTGNMVSTSLIILSLIIIEKKTLSYRLALSVIFTISLLDIFNYWLCYKQCALILAGEVVLMATAAALILLRKWKRN